jgi:hypothetical protein
MSYGYQYPYQPPPKRRSWGFTCLITLVVLVFLLLALALGVLFYLKPRLSQGAGDTLGGQLDALIDEKLGQNLEGVEGQVPAGFNEQIVISEAEVNQYIQDHPQDIAPLDSVVVDFVAGEMRASVSAYGFSGTARSGVAASNGRIVLVDPTIDGPLAFVIDAQQLGQSLEARLNQELTSSNAQASAIEVQSDQIVATIEAR